MSACTLSASALSGQSALASRTVVLASSRRPRSIWTRAMAVPMPHSSGSAERARRYWTSASSSIPWTSMRRATLYRRKASDFRGRPVWQCAGAVRAMSAASDTMVDADARPRTVPPPFVL